MVLKWRCVNLSLFRLSPLNSLIPLDKIFLYYTINVQALGLPDFDRLPPQGRFSDSQN